MISLDVATDRLLHRVSYRQAFLDGRFDELDLAAADIEALQCIDRQQLIETAESVRSALLQRKHRGSGGIHATWPTTLAAWQSSRDDESLELFLDTFMESEAFGRYREVPHAGAGLSMEEAVYCFFEAHEIGDRQVREAEFLGGLCKALALNTRPSFTVGPPLRLAPAGWFAVSRRGPPRLFAALRGNYVSGELTPFLADLLVSDQPPSEIAETHAVPPEVVAAAVARFTELGLLAAPP
jgi:hypothetical protein